MTKFSSLIDRIKNYHKNKRWQSRTILTLLVLLFILGLARLLLSQTIIYSATSWLKEQGIDSTIEAIDISIIDGTVSLVNAKGYKDGTALFNIGLVDIYWRWAPLSKKTMVISKVGLDEFSVNIEHYSDDIIIGGVHIPLNTTPIAEAGQVPAKTENPDEKTKSWAASLGEVIFTNLNVCYLQHTTTLEKASKNSLFVDYCVALEKMSWAGTISYATDNKLLNTDDLPLSSTGDFRLNGLNITDNKLNKKLLSSKSNTLKNVVISGLGSLHIDQLKMNELSLLQREDKKHRDSIRFSQLVIDDIKLSNMNALTIKSISINKPGFYLVKQNPTDWEYQQWIPQSTITSKTAVEPKDDKQTSNEPAFKLSLNNVNIKDSDLCYLDSSPSLYYCLTFTDLDWKGSIKLGTESSQADEPGLQIKGDLKLSKQKIHNQTLDRDLIAAESITLSELDVSSVDDVSLNSLNIEKLAALQRSESKDDQTASFEKLAIKNVKYTGNKLEINTINLEGLANNISKNKDGNWEFDKWQTKNKPANKTTKEAAKSQTRNSEPLIISLNTLNIITNKKISFTDNSTKPVMKLGLTNLQFDLKDLHASKPDENSRFKLYAKTFRHSTMDIEGTIKPFAEKISFDANGKLKGLDLRAASPATKKAIGHTIQSGQMDADLTLLAVDGELDSNIALSLYHFNIKAASKKDAEKLDEKFGMPLNQTLVLLRDRDDSIHLDIPITGDVNNPNFQPMDAIIKATTKAATVTLITFYTPYGLIYAGGSVAFNLATALNFDPINFAPGSAEILNDGKEQLDGLTKLLVEKPQVHLTLCGVTNQQDVYALFPTHKQKQETKADDEKNNTEIKLNDEQSSKLTQLAKDRQINAKNYLVDESGIEHDRLILCAPEHNTDEDAIAGVEIVI